MKQSLALLGVMLVGVVVFAQQPAPNPEVAAALAKQAEIEKNAPRLQITEEVLPLVVPGHTIGEAVGVAKNSKGHLFVFTRSGATGPAKGATASQLFEFDPDTQVREAVGTGQLRGLVRAHRPRRQGRQRLDDRRRLEHGRQVQPRRARCPWCSAESPKPSTISSASPRKAHKETARRRRRGPASFNRPTDVTWDTEGNIFVADGYNNSRVAKMSKDGTWVGASATRGAGRTSSTRRTPSPTTPRATSTSPIAATAASRCSIRC